jgi:hypothetical protein
MDKVELRNCQKNHKSQTPKELEAIEIEPDTLKQMRNVCDPITAPFEDFGDFVEPVVERNQKGIRAIQPTSFDLIGPVGNGAPGRLFTLFSVKDRAQLFAKVIGLRKSGAHSSSSLKDSAAAGHRLRYEPFMIFA